jgi:hypothetical protein
MLPESRKYGQITSAQPLEKSFGRENRRSFTPTSTEISGREATKKKPTDASFLKVGRILLVSIHI